MIENTKEALAASLFRVLEKKPLDKITIGDLTDDCGINRQTFYYHYHDIYELIEWIYMNKAKEAIGDNRTYVNWQDGMIEMCRVMLQYKTFVLKTYHSKSGGNLEPLLLKYSYSLLMDVVNEISKNENITEEHKSFIADFYKYGFVGLILQWVSEGMKEDPKRMVTKLEYLIQGNFKEAVKRYSLYDRNNRTNLQG